MRDFRAAVIRIQVFRDRVSDVPSDYEECPRRRQQQDKDADDASKWFAEIEVDYLLHAKINY